MARRIFPLSAEISEEKKSTEQFDWWFVAVFALLLCVGLLMVFSTSTAISERYYDNKYTFFQRQCLFAFIGTIALLVAANISREFLNKLTYLALFGSMGLVILTLTPLGVSVNGSQRWLSLGFIQVQPLEFAKIGMALYLAYFMSTKQDIIRTFSKGVIPPFFITGLMSVLLLLQPDFGGAMIMVFLLFLMCLIGGTRLSYLATSFVGLFISASLLILNSPYRVRRLSVFLDPFKDAADAGYQLVQSLYAIGSGGFFGVGIGSSVQKMLYLPEAHNDFIIAVLAEETGFLGMTLLLALFVMLFLRCHRIIIGQKNLRDRYTAFALTAVLAIGVILNYAVVMGLVPTKGIAMPFLSYGGSNLLANMICIGLLLNYSRTAKS